MLAANIYSFVNVLVIVPWRRGAVDITAASKTDPCSNPGHKVFRKNIAMLLCVFELNCIVCELKK
jgi:hypothetical protein